MPSALPSTICPRSRRRRASGFSIVEVLITISVFAVLTVLMVGAYQSGNERSKLARQVGEITSTIRLAQEQAASGTSLKKYCSATLGNPTPTSCTTTCAPGDGNCVAAVPPGGEGVVFDCANRTAYSQYADTFACAGDCFGTPTGTENDADRLLTLPKDGLRQAYPFVTGVAIVDLRVQSGSASYTCASGSPWLGHAVPPTSSTPAATPKTLQATALFRAPDGRQLTLTDGYAQAAPDAAYALGEAWDSIQVMLGLQALPSDCTVITVTREGVVSRDVDANCSFSS